MNLTFEQINKIAVGETYTSWKKLCEAIGIEYKKGGRNQSYQKLNLRRYLEFEQEGRKYTILAKRDVPLLKPTSSKSPYRKLLQILILDLVSDSDDCCISITQDRLFYSLYMVNQDFLEYRLSYNRRRLSKELGIKPTTIEVFYSRHSSNFKSLIQGTLNSLQNQKIIQWSHSVRFSLSNGEYRKASNHEISLILECQSEIMEEWGCSDFQEVHMNNIYNRLVKEATERYNERYIRDGIYINFFFHTYDIVYNNDKKYVDKNKRKIADKLEMDYKISVRSNLNQTVVENILENVKKRTTVSNFIESENLLTDKLIKT